MMAIKISAKQMETLKNLYKSNKDSLKELENFISEHGVTDCGLTDATESFEQGYNNAMEQIFNMFGIDFDCNMTVDKLKKHFEYEFECNLTEDYKDEDDCDEWASAFVWFGDIGVEYNFCIDNSTNEMINSSAIYKTEINEYLTTDYDKFVHYEIDFDNENWMEDLENAMCKALIEFHNL